MLESRRWAVLILLPLLLCQAAWAKPGILDIRLGIHPGLTRVVVELSEAAPYRVGLLAGPPRLSIELPESGWQGRQLPKILGQVSSLGMASNGGLTTLTAVLHGPAKLGAVMMIPGATDGLTRRLVVDLMPATSAEFASALMAAPVDSAPPLVVPGPASPDAPVVANSGPPPQGPSPASPPATGPAPARLASTSDMPGAWPSQIPMLKPVPNAAPVQPAPSTQVAQIMPLPLPTLATTRIPGPAPASAPTLVSATPTSGAEAGLPPPDGASSGPAIRPPGVPTLKPNLAKLPLVYIDPGHGGPDPGTIGHNGTYEKNVTLAMARELQRQLLATGRYRVKLTRNNDRYVPLRARFEMAREDQADIFISLHADSSFVGDPRGASVYTLSETSSDAEAAALATKENKSDLIAGVDLTKQNAVVASILIDLTQRETKNMSAHLAELMVDEMKQVTLLLPNTHRFAGFAVLKAPDIPSILIEMGYLSNTQDEALLLSAEHRAKLAAAMLRAVEGYFAPTVVSSRS